MSLIESNPIERVRKPEYVMSLYVYPVALCGDDLQKGNPLEVSAKGDDLYALKMRTEELILSCCDYDGECFVEIRVEKDGQYCESDEVWAEVDLVAKKVKIGGHCRCAIQ